MPSCMWLRNVVFLWRETVDVFGRMRLLRVVIGAWSHRVADRGVVDVGRRQTFPFAELSGPRDAMTDRAPEVEKRIEPIARIGIVVGMIARDQNPAGVHPRPQVGDLG